MTSVEGIRKLWKAFYGNDLSELLVRIGLFFSAMVTINAGFADWNRFPVAFSLVALLISLSLYMSGFFMIILSLLTGIRVARLAYLIPIAIVFAIATNYLAFLP